MGPWAQDPVYGLRSALPGELLAYIGGPTLKEVGRVFLAAAYAGEDSVWVIEPPVVGGKVSMAGPCCQEEVEGSSRQSKLW